MRNPMKPVIMGTHRVRASYFKTVAMALGSLQCASVLRIAAMFQMEPRKLFICIFTELKKIKSVPLQMSTTIPASPATFMTSSGTFGSNFSNVSTGTYISNIAMSGNITASSTVSLGSHLLVSSNVTVTGNITGSNYISAPYVSAGNIGFFRNRIINGDMRIDQRHEGTVLAVSSGAPTTVDKFGVYNSQAVVVNLQRSSLPTPLLGFNYALKFNPVGTSSSTTGILHMFQNIEGYNIADLNWGTSIAVSITVSFYIYISVAGTYSCFLSSSAGMANSQPFTITAAQINTWQQISLTYAGPQTGTWNLAASQGLTVNIQLMAGGTYVSANNTWLVASGNGAIGATTNTFMSSTANVAYITGVQFEKGTVATPFEFRPYAEEMRLCQRTFEKSYDAGTVPGSISSSGTAGDRTQVSGTNIFVVQGYFLTQKMYSSNSVTIYSPNDGSSGHWYQDNNGGGTNSNVAVYSGSVGNRGVVAYMSGVQMYAGNGVTFQWTCEAEIGS